MRPRRQPVGQRALEIVGLGGSATDVVDKLKQLFDRQKKLERELESRSRTSSDSQQLEFIR